MGPEPVCPESSYRKVKWMTVEGNRLVLHLIPVRTWVSCPLCGGPSRRIHSRYRRRALDLPWFSWLVQLVVRAHAKRLELLVRSAVPRITEPPTTSRRRYHLMCTQAPLQEARTPHKELSQNHPLLNVWESYANTEDLKYPNNQESTWKYIYKNSYRDLLVPTESYL